MLENLALVDIYYCIQTSKNVYGCLAALKKEYNVIVDAENLKTYLTTNYNISYESLEKLTMDQINMNAHSWMMSLAQYKKNYRERMPEADNLTNQTLNHKKPAEVEKQTELKIQTELEKQFQQSQQWMKQQEQLLKMQQDSEQRNRYTTPYASPSLMTDQSTPTVYTNRNDIATFFTTSATNMTPKKEKKPTKKKYPIDQEEDKDYRPPRGQKIPNSSKSITKSAKLQKKPKMSRSEALTSQRLAELTAPQLESLLNCKPGRYRKVIPKLNYDAERQNFLREFFMEQQQQNCEKELNSIISELNPVLAENRASVREDEIQIKENDIKQSYNI